MDWQDLYKQKLTSVEEAVGVVRSGDRVVLSHCAGESLTLSRALVERAPNLEDVTIIHFLMLGQIVFVSRVWRSILPICHYLLASPCGEQ